MTEFDYVEDEKIAVGLEHDRNDLSATIVGLEYFKEEIAKRGFNRDLHKKVCAVSPTALAKINPAAVTINLSKTNQQVAVEAIDAHVAKLVGAGAVAALATGGVGVLAYKFIKWLRSKLNSGAGNLDGETTDAASANVSADAVKNNIDKKAKVGSRKVAEAPKDIKGIFDGLDDNVAKVAHLFAYRYGTSVEENKPTLIAITKSSLARSEPDIASLMVGKKGLPMAALGAYHYKIDGQFITEVSQYTTEVFEAFQSMGEFLNDPSDTNAAKLVSTGSKLTTAHSFSSRAQKAANEYGTDASDLFTKRIGYAHAVSPDQIQMSPDDSAAHEFIDYLTNQKYNETCNGVSGPYAAFTALLAKFEATGVKLEKEITQREIDEVNKKAKDNAKVKDAMKDIQKGVSNALKLKQILNRSINSVAQLKGLLVK